jgi:AcrR family transcriptional regulator
MPKDTFHRLPTERRARLVDESIVEFAERSFAEASLSEIARRAKIPKGSFYQYFDDKLDLYRWLLLEEVPRRKREFIGADAGTSPFWTRLERHIERGLAFLVVHPLVARMSAAAAHPSAIAEVRGLHNAVCEAGLVELRELLEGAVSSGELEPIDVQLATRFVASVIGPGLTDVVLHELRAELHEVLASDVLRRRLTPKLRARLARQTVSFIRSGLTAIAPTERKRR